MNLLFVANVTITTDPFRISFPGWHRAVALILIVSGFLVYGLGEYGRGYRKWQNKYSKKFDRVIEKLEKTNKSNETEL